MPTVATIAITPGSGQLLDGVQLIVGANTVIRETMVLADPNNATQLANVTAGGALQVDASATTQPVSIAGTVTISGTITANQGGNWNVRAQDGSGNALTSTSSALDVNLKTSSITLPISGTVSVTNFANPLPVSQSGTWNVRAQDGAGNALTTNSTTPTGKFALDQNIVSILGTAPTTAGKLDVKGADGDVFVRQATAANLNATVVGTVTANIGTTGGLALDTSVNGLLLSQGSATSGQKGPLIQGAVTTNAPSYTTAQTSPLSLDTSGLLRVSLKDTPANTNNFNVNLAASTATVTVTGTITANQGGAPWSQNLTQVAGTSLGATAIVNYGSTPAAVAVPAVNAFVTNTVAISGTITANQGTNPWTIQGDSASGTAKAGNPVQIGAVFNTTQPTVSSGQTVEAQATAHGGLIVATGVDTFNVTINAALPAGGNTIGAVTQASGPWTQNLTQVGGSAVTLGAKASAASIPVVLATDEATLPVAPTSAGTTGTTAPAVADETGIVDSQGNLRAAAGTAIGPQTVIQTQESGIMLDILRAMLAELRGIRLAMTAIATDGGKYKDSDFLPVPDNQIDSLTN